MKQLVKNFTFDHVAKTVTLTDFTTVLLSRLALITDVTTNTILYNFADASTTTATVATNVITLAAIPGGCADTDKLRIDYDGLPADPSVDESVVTGDNGQNAKVVAGARKEVTFTTTTVQAVGSTDVSNYRSVSVQITSQGTSSSIAYQVSNDNVNWVNCALVNSASTVGSASASSGSTGISTGPLLGRYFRLNVVGISAGTTAGVIEFSSLPAGVQTMGVAVLGQSGNGGTAPSSSLVVGARASSGSPSTVSDGQTVAFMADLGGRLHVLLDDGTNAANVIAGDSGQNALVTAGSRKEVAFTTTSVANLASTDVSNYGFVSVHMTSQGGSSTVTFQVSNDNTNWLTLQLQQTQFGTISTSTSAVDFYTGPTPARYFRLAVTGIASGTTAGVVEFFSAPRSPQLAPFVGQQVAGTANSGATLKSAPVRVGAAYHTTQPTVVDGQAVDVQATARGATIVATGVDALVAQVSDGTNTANVMAGDSGQNAQFVANSRKEVSFSTSTVQAIASTDVSNYRTVNVHVTAQGGSSSVNFQCSNDNTNWINCSLTNVSTVGASIPTLNTTAAVIYTGSLTARYFRLNVTGIVSGTTTGVMEFGSSASGALTNPTALTDSSGNLASIVAGDSGQNSLVIAPARKEVSFTTTIVAAVGSTDVSNYKSVSVHVTSQGGSSTVTFQCSNDNSNWLSCPLQLSSNATNAASTSTASASQLWYGVLPGRYFRLNVTGIASGTTAGVIEFSSAPVTLATLGIAAIGASTNASAVPGSSLVVAGRAATASPTAVTNGQVAPLMTDTLGKTVVAPYANPENIINGVSISITGTGSTQVVAAQAASVRSYITSLDFINASATVGTQVNILDGATVITSVFLGPTTQSNCSQQTIYPVPLRGTAATAVNAQCVTTGSAVQVVAHGYTAP